MTRVAGPDCAVMYNLIKTHIERGERETHTELASNVNASQSYRLTAEEFGPSPLAR